MKIIFLDIDGVIVTRNTLRERYVDGLRGYCVPKEECVQALNKLTDETNASIVLSSSWRFCGLLEMRTIFSLWGISAPLIDFTPDLTRLPSETKSGLYEAVPRGREIQQWLDQQTETINFVIIDDCSDMEHLSNHFVHIDSKIGFTENRIEQAIEILLRLK